MYKNNSRDSSKCKACSPLQLSGNLTGKKPAIGYFLYTLRYMTKIIKEMEANKRFVL